MLFPYKNLVTFILIVTSTWLISGCATYKAISLDINSNYREVEAYLEPKIENKPNAPASDLYLLCRAYGKLKKYNKLFPCIDRLQARIDAGDTSFALADISYTPATILSEAYIELAQYTEAAKQGKIACDFVTEHNPSLMISGRFVTDALSTCGLAYALGGYDENAEEALKLLKDLDTTHLGTVALEMPKKFGIAKIYMALGRYQDAVDITSRETSTLTVVKNLTKYTSSLIGLGSNPLAFVELPYNFIKYKSLFETGRFDEAKSGFDRLLADEKTQQNGAIYWQILFDRGRIAQSEGQFEQAISFYKVAVNVFEQQRTTINNETSKIGFVGDKQAVYYHLITALFENGRLTEAFEYAERAKARALVDMLAEKKQFSGENVDIDEVAALLQELNEAEMQSIAVAYQDASSEEIVNVRSVAVKKNEQIAQVSPQLASLVSVSTANIKTIQSLLPADETLVEYFGSGDTLFAFIVSNNGVRGVKLEIKGLNQKIETFRKYIMLSPKEIRGLTKVKVSDSSIPATRANQLQTSGETLYEKLIQPLKSMIHTKNLTIVPHGALHYLPFNALNSGGEYLIDRYNIRVLPSASVMKFLKDRREGHAGNLLAFGNPDLGDPTYDLPGAQNEAIAITKDQPKSKVLLRNQATETAVKQYGAGFRYLHFATHGTFDAEKPLSSGLLMAGDSENDGTLTVGELYDLHLPADLVTLSACETALGKVANGDDVVGFTRGFLYAGTSSIVSSLWKVDDQATSILMQEFYKSLKETDKRSALRTAQLKVKNTYNSHPFFWAAFQITGSVQ